MKNWILLIDMWVRLESQSCPVKPSYKNTTLTNTHLSPVKELEAEMLRQVCIHDSEIIRYQSYCFKPLPFGEICHALKNNKDKDNCITFNKQKNLKVWLKQVFVRMWRQREHPCTSGGNINQFYHTKINLTTAVKLTILYPCLSIRFLKKQFHASKEI